MSTSVPMKLTFPSMPWFHLEYSRKLYYTSEPGMISHYMGDISPTDNRQHGEPDYWGFWPKQPTGWFDAHMMYKLAELIDYFNGVES